MYRFKLIAFSICCIIFTPFEAKSRADVPRKVIQELAEQLLKSGSKEAAEMGLETIAKKVETLVVKYGDDAVGAVKNAGPRTFRYIEEAGENGGEVIKILARHGNEAVWVVAKKDRMAIFIKYGDDAAEAMIKQGEIAEPLIKSLGKPATEAFKVVSKQNGRRLAMMAEEADTAVIAKNEEVLGIISKYGDKAMDFIWKNKASLVVAATLTAFLANPQSFIDGAVSVTETGVESVATPIATGISERLNFNYFIPLMGLVFAGLAAFKLWLRHKTGLVPNQTDVSP